MDYKCVVFGCRNSYITLEKPKVDCLFFHFPLKNQDLTKEWLKNLRLQGWMPGPENVVCEEHFSSNDYDTRCDKVTLKLEAIPCLTNNLDYLIPTNGNVSEDESGSSENEFIHSPEGIRCRICAKSISPKKAIHMYSKGERIIEKIMACIPIPLNIEDNLPKHLCRTCLLDLNVSYRMLVRAIESEKFFHGVILKSSEKTNEESNVDTSIRLDIHDTRTSCVICNENFDNVLNLKEHFERKHLLGYHADESNLEKTDMTITNECTSESSKSEQLPNYKVSQSLENLPLTVTKFYKDFQDCSDSLLNSFSVKCESTNDYWCQICSTVYNSEGLLNAHIDEAHIESIVWDESFCEEQQEKSFSVEKVTTPQNNVNQSQVSEKGVARTHMCVICSSVFATVTNLNRHQREVHRIMHFNNDRRLQKYVCNFCGKEYNSKVAVESHERIHTDVRPFKCSECGRGFKSKTTLLQHNLVHSGIKKYKCSICDKAFARKSFIVNHLRIHTGDRPFACDICGNRYTQIGDMRRHRRRHSETKSKNENSAGSENQSDCSSVQKDCIGNHALTLVQTPENLVLQTDFQSIYGKIDLSRTKTSFINGKNFCVKLMPNISQF